MFRSTLLRRLTTLKEDIAAPTVRGIAVPVLRLPSPSSSAILTRNATRTQPASDHMHSRRAMHTACISSSVTLSRSAPSPSSSRVLSLFVVAPVYRLSAISATPSTIPSSSTPSLTQQRVRMHMHTQTHIRSLAYPSTRTHTLALSRPLTHSHTSQPFRLLHAMSRAMMANHTVSSSGDDVHSTPSSTSSTPPSSSTTQSTSISSKAEAQSNTHNPAAESAASATSNSGNSKEETAAASSSSTPGGEVSDADLLSPWQRRFFRASDIALGLLFGVLLYKCLVYVLDEPDVIPLVIDAALEDEAVMIKVGKPAKASWRWSGNVNTHDAALVIPITGPNGSATLHARALYDGHSQSWKLMLLQASFDGLPQRHSLNIPERLLIQPRYVSEEEAERIRKKYEKMQEEMAKKHANTQAHKQTQPHDAPQPLKPAPEQ